MPERPVGIASLPQRIEQYLGSALQIVLQLGVAAHGHLVDRELVGVGAASADELDHGLGLGDVGLVELRATENKLTSIPGAISQLSRLRELHLRNNRLTTLPDAIRQLAELRQLDLRGNPLRDLPAALAKLPRLEKLDLRWVTTLPDLPWLAALELRGCLVYR